MNVRLTRESVRDLLLDAICDDDVLGSGDAFAAVNRIFDHVVKAVRRDSRFPRLSRNELDLVLADARRATDEELVGLIAGRVDLRVALDAGLDVIDGKPST